MRSFTGMATRIYLLILVLIAGSLACNYPTSGELIKEGISENCTEIDRETYERLAAELGQTPETPKYPETAVYEACSHEKVAGFDLYGEEGEVASVRMSDGYKPEEGEDIPNGTYAGETSFYTTLNNDVDNSYLEPVCSENTVNLVITSTGSAQGEIRSICYSKQDTDNEEMQMTHHSDVTAVIQGELEGSSGQLSIAYTWHTYITSPQWDAPGIDKTVTFEFQYNVTISNGVMTLTPAGDVEAYYSFELTRE